MLRFALLSLLFVASTAAALAQVEAGRWFATGTLSIDNSAVEDEDAPSFERESDFTSVGFSMRLFKQTNDNTAWGFGVNYNPQWNSSETSDAFQTQEITSNLHSISAGPVLRKTFADWKGFYVFTDFSVTAGIEFGDSENEITGLSPGTSNTDTFGWFAGAGISPGLAVRLSDRFLLTGSFSLFQLNYGWEETESASSGSLYSFPDKRTTQNLSARFFPNFSLGSITVGIQWVLGSSK